VSRATSDGASSGAFFTRIDMNLKTKHRLGLTVMLIASMSPVYAASEATRILRFPQDQYVGQLSAEDPCLGSEYAELGRDLSYPFGFDPKRVCLAGDWDVVGLARGETLVPANRNLLLTVLLRPKRTGWARLPEMSRRFLSNRVNIDPEDLSGLSELGPNDLYALRIASMVRRRDAGRQVLEPISRLTGLQVLGLSQTGLTDAQMHYLKPLQSLRALELQQESWLGNTGLAVLKELPALEYLDLDTSTTDVGCKHLGQLQHLRWLRLRMGRIWGPGLAELAKLPRLERLSLWGTTGLSDRHVRYLEGLTGLKSLTLWSGGYPLTDATLASIGRLTRLEELYFIRVSQKFTDAGMGHLESLRNLRRLSFTFCQLGAEGMQHLANLPWLESVKGLAPTADAARVLPSFRSLKSLDLNWVIPPMGTRVPPEVVSAVGALDFLEELSISGGQWSQEDLLVFGKLNRLKRLSLGMDEEYGEPVLAEIARLKDLESFSLSGKGVTKDGLNQLRDLTRLQTLNVTILSPTGPGIDETPLALSSLKRLKTLDLFGLALQDGDLASLAGLSDLEWLRFQGGFTEAGLPYLVGLPKVKLLDIRGISCPTGVGLTHLQALEGLGDLKLRGRITDEALRQLPALPGVWSFEAETDQPIRPDTAAWLREHLPALEYLYIREPLQYDRPAVGQSPAQTASPRPKRSKSQRRRSR